MKVTIFYSWQSASPNNTNRGFIEKALHKAIEAIKAEDEMVIDPCVERDVQGIPGTPDIAQAIFRKIDQCRIFVGDVTIINPSTSSDRKTPNPNVLIELGYAAKALTWDYVICIYNTAFGSVKDLPFDLQTRLMCTYSASEEQENKSEERDKLASKLRGALLPMLQQITHKFIEDSTPKQLLPDQAGAKAKEFLSDERYRIQLSDLVIEQGNELSQKITGSDFPVSMSTGISSIAIKERVADFEAISDVAMAILIQGCYFGTPSHHKLWNDLLARIANPQGERNGLVTFLNLRRYPALLLQYAGGISAVAAEHYDTLLSLLTKPKVLNERNGKYESPLLLLTTHEVLSKDDANRMDGTDRYAPVSQHIFDVLRKRFQVLLPDDRQYQRCFDRFEYLRSLLDVDLTGDPQSIGLFGWRWKYPDQDVMKEIDEEEKSFGTKWPLYQAGWFEGRRERFAAARQKVREVIARLQWN